MKTNHLTKTLFFFILFITLQFKAQTLIHRYDFTNGSLTNSVDNLDLNQSFSFLTFSNDALTGQSNSAALLNNDYLLNTAETGTSNGSNDDLTIAFWIKTDENSSLERAIITHYSGIGWKVTLLNGQLHLNAKFASYAVGGTYEYTSPDVNFTSNFIADNQWHFIAITIDENRFPSTYNWIFQVRYKTYIDDVLVDNSLGSITVSNTFSDFLRVVPPAPNGQLIIGNDETLNGERYFDEIDNIRYYRGLLTENQISGLYVAPKTIYVDINASGNNDGTSWANAFTDLNDALLEYTNDEDEIWVAQGTYKPDVSSKTNAFVLLRDVKIYGGFNGTETQLSQRDWRTNETILSGDLNDDDNAVMDFNEPSRSDNSYVVVRINGNNTIVDGFTISGGQATHASNNSYNKGGAIQKSDGVTTFNVKNCIIKNNVGMQGAGIYTKYNHTGTFRISNCKFDNNVARYGASYVARSYGGTLDAIVDNSLFINNVSKNNTTNDGFSGSAGMFATHNSSTSVYGTINVKIVNCTIADNIENGTHTANTSVGVIVLARYQGLINAKIYNTIFWNNTRLSNVNQANSLGKMNGNLAGWLEFKYNISPEASVTSYASTVYESDNTNQDPDWINSGIWKYNLYTTSPAVDMGDNSKVDVNITEDLLGNTRIQGGTVDLGCYEYNSTLGLNNKLIEESLRIYPNPVSDVLNIEFNSEIKQVSVFNSFGKLVLVSNNKNLNVSNLTKGIYIIKVEDFNGITINKKFIKK